MKELESEFNQYLEVLKHFMPVNQLSALKDIYKGEESIYAVEIAKQLTIIINSMPETYQTEATPIPETIVHLHYFYGGSDWYIIEKDKGSELDEIEAGLEVGGQHQAFGYAILNDDKINAEWGFISIQELIEIGFIELDFHFTPVRFGDLF